MCKRISPTVFALLLAAGPAFAQFEGIMEMKMTMTAKGGEGGGSGTMNVAVGKAGTRSEMNMKMGQMAMNLVMLQKSDTPDVIYRLNDANKSYTEIDLTKVREIAGQKQTIPEFTVEKLGQETVLGYQTQHVLVKEKNPTNGDLTKMEMWTAKDLLDYATYSKLQARPGKGDREKAILKALKSADADGMPIKAITTASDGSKSTIEVLKADKKSLPASTFEIPADYTKSAGGMMDMIGGMSNPQAEQAMKKMGDAQKKMDDAMKTMTPEQREMIQKMMKQQKAGSQ